MYFNNHTFINKDTFITKLLRSAVLVMALLSTFSYARAQEVYLEDDDSLSVDSMSMDTLSVRSQTLPWHLAVKEELDHMLQADMFSTSQVGMMVYDLDADSVLYAHGAKAVGTEGENDTFLSVDEEGKVTGMEIGSSVPTRDCASLKVYITKRELLRQLVEQAAANGMHDFDRDILQRNINDGNLRVYGYEYKGLACQIDSIQSYFNFNMSLLSGDVRRQLFPADRPVYTKVRDDLPTRYVEECECSNSLIANGCMIEGTVINSVLFRGVKVAKGAVVKNSIVMQDAQIQEGAEIDHCILDKQSVIRRNGRLIAPAAYPIVIAKNVVI